jgi:Flp pilus assembly protein TadG
MRAIDYRRAGRNRGSSIIETAAGLFVVIPILLFFMDIGYVLLAQMANDALAKEAARASAEATSQAQSDANATNVVQNYFASQDSMFIQPPGGFGAPDTALVLPTNYNPTTGGVASGVVTVTTQIVCKVPCPLPGFPNPLQFSATATEPIVALLPTN